MGNLLRLIALTVVAIMGIALGLVINKSLSEPEVTITGYTEDGRVDYDTKEGKKIFRQDCEDVGIILPRRDDD